MSFLVSQASISSVISECASLVWFDDVILQRLHVVVAESLSDFLYLRWYLYILLDDRVNTGAALFSLLDLPSSRSHLFKHSSHIVSL